MAWPIIKEAIEDFCNENIPTTLTMVDLGCSSGPNTLMIVSKLIKQFHKNLHSKPLQYQIFFNDLPANDFNAIFRSLPNFLEDLKNQIGTDFGNCFFNGVPGSFYGRLFPNKTLHFVHSSYTLHWLSQVILKILFSKKIPSIELIITFKYVYDQRGTSIRVVIIDVSTDIIKIYYSPINLNTFV